MAVKRVYTTNVSRRRFLQNAVLGAGAFVLADQVNGISTVKAATATLPAPGGPRPAPGPIYTMQDTPYQFVEGTFAGWSNGRMVVVDDAGSSNSFAVSSSTSFWRGGSVGPAAMTANDRIMVNALKQTSGPPQAVGVWSNIGWVNGVCQSISDDQLTIVTKRGGVEYVQTSPSTDVASVDGGPAVGQYVSALGTKTSNGVSATTMWSTTKFDSQSMS